jgi:hypothetical protein
VSEWDDMSNWSIEHLILLGLCQYLWLIYLSYSFCLSKQWQVFIFWRYATISMTW